MAVFRYRGGKYDDVYLGSDATETIEGRGGNDTLAGGGGNDVVDGGAGDDVISGGAGADLLKGGKGFDTLSYADWRGEVHVDLSLGYARTFFPTEDDTISGFERVLGGAYDDSMIGDAAANELRGGGGNDYLKGGAGDDLLSGGLGSDTLDGGEGFDFADYSDAAGAVSVALWTPNSAGGAAGSDQLIAIEGVYGSAFDDMLSGNGVANHLLGGTGNDVLIGNAGDDTLSGGTGRDLLTGGTGRDYFAFAAADVSPTLRDADHVTDFSQADGDQIDLRAIDANVFSQRDNAFRFIGDDAFHGRAGELRFAVRDGYTVIEGDVNGDARADGVIVLDGEHHLTASDFML